MTRINLVNPTTLSNQHLLAEYRELPRIFSHVSKHGVSTDIQDMYTLGKGHVLFFTNKLRYLMTRYQEIYDECKKRGINVVFTPSELYDKYSNLFCAIGQICWTPKQNEIEISNSRIQEKLSMKPNFYTWSKNNED